MKIRQQLPVYSPIPFLSLIAGLNASAALSGRDERTMMKLVVDRRSDRVLGVHMVGPDAGEMIQLVGIAVKMKATKADVDAVMAVHPTVSEELVTLREKALSRRQEAAE